MRALLISLLGGVLLTGCFSTADFDTCTGAGQCGLDAEGRGLVCRAGECVRPGDDDGDLITGALEQSSNRAGQTVRLADVTLQSPVVRLEAEVIIIDGAIDGAGAGERGGNGGDFGALGSDLGRDGEPGHPRGEGASRGGEGGDGGRACQSDGAPGLDGLLTLPCDATRTFDLNVAGRGGGGGGGGSGTALCRGSSGGRGGDGGAALMLKATRYIEIRGAIDVRGTGGRAPEAFECMPDDPDALACPDAPEADPAEIGDGGPGGGGSGGHVYLEAPTIVFSRGAAIDISGGGGGGVGAVTLVGAIEGRFERPAGRDAELCALP